MLPDEPDAVLRTRYLLHPRSSFGRSQHTHPHPFQSPDGNVVLFNSDESDCRRSTPSRASSTPDPAAGKERTDGPLAADYPARSVKLRRPARPATTRYCRSRGCRSEGT